MRKLASLFIPVIMMGTLAASMVYGENRRAEMGMRSMFGDYWTRQYHDEQFLIDQFHLPQDVEFVAVKQAGRRSARISAVVQFTPGQYEDYVDALDDPSVWQFQPFDHSTYRVDGTPQGDIYQWWPNIQAWIQQEEPNHMLRWAVRIGFIDDAGDGKPRRHDLRDRRTMCYGIGLLQIEQRIAPCHDWPEYGGPPVVVTAVLDDEYHRLFMFVG